MKYARPPSPGNSAQDGPRQPALRGLRSAQLRNGGRAARGHVSDRVTNDSVVDVEIADPRRVTRSPRVDVPVHEGIQIGREHVAEPASAVDRYRVRHLDGTSAGDGRQISEVPVQVRDVRHLHGPLPGEVDRPGGLGDASTVGLVPTVEEARWRLDVVPVALEDRRPTRPLEAVEFPHVHARVRGPEGSAVGEPDDVGCLPGIKVGLGGGRPLVGLTSGGGWRWGVRASERGKEGQN